MQGLKDLDDTTDNQTFTLHFMRFLNNFMTWMIEILYKSRDKRENNSGYAPMYENLSELHRYIRLYVQTVLRGEQFDMQQLLAPRTYQGRRRN